MDAFLLVAIVLVLGLAVAPMFLMRGQWGKRRGSGDSSGGGYFGGDPRKGHDTGSDGGGGDGGGD